ncbi:NACHT, LRR and PYD domains-containing protein 3-like [Protopterus annectens]|uniref:NACHT, LRR and PYD domains-containing protein 3-like n=1 Tax=Protopterus annectens TaxID=7888 RepID=UPI001CFA06AD|nr:NACHT, LRR and PYD domains-containing protein 3-like [Protopterus annectens]
MDASCSKEQLRRIHWKRACCIRSHEEQKTSQEKTLMTHYEQNFKELKTMLSNYSNINLYRVTKFYKQRLTDAIYPFCDCIAFALDSKHLPDENYKDVISLYDKNQKREAAHYLMDTVIAKKNCDTIMEMWEYILLASTKSIKLKNLLTEMQMKGNNVLSDAQLKEFGVKDIPDTLRDCVKEHKNVLAEKNKEIQVNTILGKETINIFPLEDNFIELIVVSASEERRLKEDELLSRGKEHEKLCQQVVQNERETVRYDEIFGSSFGNKCNARLAVISGVAGIGKSTLVQKIVFEWAIDRIYEQFHFVFPFKFRDLNRLTNISIHDMILHFYPYLKLHLSTILMKPEQVLFIFDGYDEFNSPIHARSELDIQFDKAACQSAAWSCSTTDIVSSLLQEKLLKDCSVLITTRPTALQFLHKVNIHLHLEVMGFSEEQRKEYFHKFTGDTKTSEKMFKYVEENDILYTMCYNPAYCAIICSSLEPAFKSERELQTPVLKTVTQLYSNFIYNILKHHNREHGESQKVLENLGDMAFMGVQDKVIVFDENLLSRFSLEPSQFLSGFLMEIFSRDESCQNIIYTFYHLTIQEFIAALVKSTPNPLEDITSLLDKAAEYKDGRCEVFLRFIVGLSTTEHKLEEFIREKTQTTVNKVIDWVKSKLHANSTGRQLLNAFHYLFETQNKELTESIMKDIKSIELQNITLSPVDCYLMFSLLSHCDEIAVLNIKDCNIQPESLKKLQPVLRNCGLLRLQGNNIGDESVKWLSEDLQKTDCKIHSLELENNKIGHLGLKYLSENLKSCTLKELRLCSNNIGDQGICCLSDALQSHYCNITRLGLSLSGITSSGMKQLSEALKHPNCKIKKLWLNGNNIENSGVKYLSDALLTSQCKLEFLSMCNVGMGEPGIRDLSDTLQRPFCDLSELYINGNYITASGVKYLAEALQSPCCKLQTLTLCESKVDDPGMKCLSAAITDLNCRLKQLDLRVNQIGSLGMEHLWKAMKSHPCKIEDLK